jgi:autotransporter-associated beta strand protein
LKSGRRRLLAAAAGGGLLTVLGALPAAATDGTWLAAPATGDWNTGTNWTSSPTVPDGTASFGTSAQTTVSFSATTSVGTIQFNAGAPTYTLVGNGQSVTLNGTGIVNNSAVTQNFTVVTPGSSLNITNSASLGNLAVNNRQLLQFNNTSTAGTANITNGGLTAIPGGALDTLNFKDSSTAGSATILNQVSGLAFFVNSSTAGNAVIFNTTGAQLMFQDTSTAGSATITNFTGATTRFQNSATAGTANITNTLGTVSFFDNSTAGSATITNNFDLTFSGSSTAGSAIIANNLLLNFALSATAGNAVITTSNSATVFFNNSTTGGNARFITQSGGTFDMSGLTSAGMTAGSIEGAGSYVLGSKNLTTGGNNLSTEVDGVISGSGGSLTKVGTGKLTLTATETYTGLTTINAGTLALSGGGNVSNSSGVVANATFDISDAAPGTQKITALSGSSGGIVKLGFNSLEVTNANGGNFAGAIQGNGNFSLDAGLQILSGTNTYTGPTNVNGGVLVVDGSIATSPLTTVDPGATLAGSGTVGNTQIKGGTLAPGTFGSSTFGPLTVTGNLSFTAASTYMIQVNSTSAGRTNVSGTATLNGATVNVNYLTTTLQAQYTILHANTAVSGTFNPTVVSNSPNVTSTLSYDGNNVFLNSKLNFATPSGPLTINQQNVANALTDFFTRTGSIPTPFAMLSPQGLTIASGELGTGVIQSSMTAADLFLNLLLDPTIAGRSGGFTAQSVTPTGYADEEALAYAAKRAGTAAERDAYAMATKAPMLAPLPVHRWSVWAAGYGGSETIGGNAIVGSQDTTARVAGAAVGADYKVSPDTLLGFALGGGGTSYSLANALGSGRTDMFQAGAYGRQNFGAAYLSAAFAYGWHDVTTNRTVAIAGLDMLQGRFQAETFSGRFEGGYRYTTPFMGITPYAAVEVISFRLPNYSEVSQTGGGLFALNYAAQTATDTRTELGLRADKSFAMANGVLTLRGRAAWAHDTDPNRAVTAIFQALPGASFVVNGARPDTDSALVSASAERKWLNGFSLAGTFEGQFSGNVTSYAGKGVVKYSW